MSLSKQLDSAIPDKYVETREQAGRTLSYLSGAYVIDRMNQVFGQGKWEYRVTELRRVFEGKVQQRNGEVFATSYVAIIELTARIDAQEVKFQDVGYGDGTDAKNPGKAHELATKEAVTDGIKRAAKNLGRSMGLELYFKTDVPPIGDEADAAPTQAKTETKPQQQPAQQQQQAKSPALIITEKQRKRLYAISQKAQWTPDQVKAFLKATLKVDSSTEIPKADYNFICDTVEKSNFKDAMAKVKAS